MSTSCNLLTYLHGSRSSLSWRETIDAGAPDTEEKHKMFQPSRWFEGHWELHVWWYNIMNEKPMTPSYHFNHCRGESYTVSACMESSWSLHGGVVMNGVVINKHMRMAVSLARYISTTASNLSKWTSAWTMLVACKSEEKIICMLCMHGRKIMRSKWMEELGSLTNSKPTQYHSMSSSFHVKFSSS